MKPVVVVTLIGLFVCACAARGDERKPPARVFRAGAFAIDVSPRKLPGIVNGGFLEAKADKVNDPLAARCLVLDDGATRLAIVVVDSCMLPRELIDRAKGLARAKTGIPTERMLISATHTHSAPAAMGALGTRPDPVYVESLPERIAEGIEHADKELAPARVGWGAIDDAEHTHCRRWIYRPDRMLADPFGGRTVRANMHPGHQNPDTVGPSGPVDPELSLLSLQDLEGRPVALLANYSMHYFGAEPISADYFGLFDRIIGERIGVDQGDPDFVALMSQGTSGDQQWRDYGGPAPQIDMTTYANAIANSAKVAYKAIKHHDWVPLAMAETTLSLRRRVPDEERLKWARPIVAALGDRTPQTLPEVYAKEAIALHEEPVRALKLQAIRIGDLGITAIPNEVFALTGLKIKALSPLPATFNIELANGSEGYVPPPEQHTLGGYTTWPARTAGLEVQAEPKIVEAVLGLLEKVSDKRRSPFQESHGPYARKVLAAKPWAYWRMGELSGPQALDSSGHARHATYEDGVAFYLPGPHSHRFSGENTVNRAPHFAGGRMRADVSGLPTTYSVSLWFWNGLPRDARAVTGYLFERGVGRAKGAPGDRLGIGGTERAAGRLLFCSGTAGNITLTGNTAIADKTWNHVVLIRSGKDVTVHLNGSDSPEIEGEAPVGTPASPETMFVADRGHPEASLEGKIDEVALFDRALSPREVADQYRSADVRPGGLDR